MPFYYDLNVPELEGPCILSKQLVSEHDVVQVNTAIAELVCGRNRIILRNAGPGVFGEWLVRPGGSVRSGQPFARMHADGEDVPYGRSYVVVEIVTES